MFMKFKNCTFDGIHSILSRVVPQITVDKFYVVSNFHKINMVKYSGKQNKSESV